MRDGLKGLMCFKSIQTVTVITINKFAFQQLSKM